MSWILIVSIAVRLAGWEFIRKPFSAEALGLKVRELLDRKS